MRFRTLYVLALALLLSISAFVFTTTPPPKSLSHDADVRIINKTSSFKVVRAERGTDTLTLGLQNNYSRRITAFVLTLGTGLRITEDFITSEVSDELGIRPQDTFQRTYRLPPDKATQDIILQAVVLDDKTGDGDPLVYEDIRDTRLGLAIQIKRSLKLLEKYTNEDDIENLKIELEAALDRPDTETLTELRAIHPIGTVNRTSQDPLSHFVKEGLSAGRADILRKTAGAKASRDKKDTLLKIKAYYEKLFTEL
jgi:hypothetical protein